MTTHCEDNMNPWKPDDNPRQARRVGKTAEEVNELGAVLARISIQGFDAIDPASEKTNRVRLQEEIADCQAQFDCTIRDLGLDHDFIRKRRVMKVLQMAEWEAHFN